MIKFETPKKLNGQQLNDELLAAGVKLLQYRNNELCFPCVDGNGDLFIDIDDKDIKKATEVIKNHIGIDITI